MGGVAAGTVNKSVTTKFAVTSFARGRSAAKVERFFWFFRDLRGLRERRPGGRHCCLGVCGLQEAGGATGAATQECIALVGKAATRKEANSW